MECKVAVLVTCGVVVLAVFAEPIAEPFAFTKTEPFTDPFTITEPFTLAEPFTKAEPIAEPFAFMKAEPFTDPFTLAKPFTLADPFTKPLVVLFVSVPTQVYKQIKSKTSFIGNPNGN